MNDWINKCIVLAEDGKIVELEEFLKQIDVKVIKRLALMVDDDNIYDFIMRGVFTENERNS